MLQPLSVSASDFSDSELKAIYIYRLTKFISFKDNLITICTLDENPSSSKQHVGNVLATIIQKKKSSKLQIKENPFISEIKGCDILYIDKTKSTNLKDILAKTNEYPIVTVSDIKSFAIRGGIFGFIYDNNNRIKMQVNLPKSRKQNIKVSATLLEMIDVIE